MSQALDKVGGRRCAAAAPCPRPPLMDGVRQESGQLPQKVTCHNAASMPGPSGWRGGGRGQVRAATRSPPPPPAPPHSQPHGPPLHTLLPPFTVQSLAGRDEAARVAVAAAAAGGGPRRAAPRPGDGKTIPQPRPAGPGRPPTGPAGRSAGRAAGGETPTTLPPEQAGGGGAECEWEGCQASCRPPFPVLPPLPCPAFVAGERGGGGVLASPEAADLAPLSLSVALCPQGRGGGGRDAPSWGRLPTPPPPNLLCPARSVSPLHPGVGRPPGQ